MTEMDHERVKIDRLSSLPPELLLTIFDLAYDPDNLLVNPLSRRLLPHIQRNLYHRIRPRGRLAYSKLLETVRTSPSLARLVEHLDTSGIYWSSYPGNFEEIIKAFPRLKTLILGYGPARDSIDGPVPPIEHLQYEPSYVRIAAYDLLSRFPLKTLDIGFTGAPSDDTLRHRPKELKLLDSLTLRHTDDDERPYPPKIWNKNLSKFVELCPNLTSLRLFDVVNPDYRRFLSRFTHLSNILTSLELHAPYDLESPSGIPCDHVLPLFSNLRTLHLEHGTISSSLPSHLRQLAHLSSLYLGPWTHDPGITSNDILSLVQGPLKLVNLESLVLDCIPSGWKGKRIGSDLVPTPGDWSRTWGPPGFNQRFEEDDARTLRAVGPENGVDITGSTLEAIDVLDAFYLEEANENIYHAFRTKSLKGLVEPSNGRRNRYPALDFDKLDPNNLKLVKIDLPDENWFALSLE